MKKYILIIALFIFNFAKISTSFGQLLIYEDIIRGGVTGAGYSSGKSNLNNGQFNLFIEPGSTIKKAYLLTFSLRNPTSGKFLINNNPIIFKMSERKSCFELTNHNQVNPICVYSKEITNIISSNDTIINLELPEKPIGYPINQGFWTCFIIVIYENLSLPQSSISVLLNNKNLTGHVSYQTNLSNPVNFNNDIGMSLYVDRTCVDATTINLLINNNNVGYLNRNDNINLNNDCSGAKGHFYYQNGQLFGLDDDIPNDSVKESDALLKINSYLNNQNGFDFATSHYRANPVVGNIPFNIAFILAYSTPCDTFSAALLTKDTTVCIGESVQLAATGGQKYEWQPSVGLSCDTCANPVASPTESTTYTVRIFNNDSCSKVYPVRLNISQPKPDTITTKRSICGDDNGEINVGEIPPWRLSENPLVYTVNGDTVQGPEIGNISPGNKELIITDANGCQFSDSLFIDEENITQSRIVYLDPEKGNAPLEITARPLLVNYIQNHQFVWIVNGDTIHTGNSNIFNYTFDEPGEYELIHITYNQYPHCADTVSTTILVYPSFFANIPNVFSPNGDGVNDVFTIKVSNTQNITWQIKNRWGQIVSEGSQDVDGSHTQKIELWDGNNANDGTYFYLIKATDFNGKVYEKQGNVSLFR